MTLRPLTLTLTLTFAFGLMNLAGCRPSAPEFPQWARPYQASLNTLTGAPPFELRLSEINIERYALPKLRDRKRPPREAPRLNMGALIGLSGCEVSALIAQRNSPLGRVMSPSQRLIYEARFLTLAPLCEAEGEALKALTQATIYKREAWRDALWRLTWEGPELSRFLSTRWLRGRPPAPPSATELSELRWLSSLVTWAERHAQLSPEARLQATKELSSRLEPALKSLTPHRGGGVLFNASVSAHLLKAWRAQLTTLSASLTPLRCAERRADLLELMRRYAALQPELSTQLKALTELTGALEGLTSLRPLPPALTPLITQGLSASSSEGEDTLLAELSAEFEGHTHALQAVFERCGLTPQDALK